MNQLLPTDVVDQIMRETRHFERAPEAFFEAWKRGAEIAGPEWFGDGTREGLRRAASKWDLRPNLLELNDALGVLSGGQRMFLSAMVSFYNSREGAAMLADLRRHAAEIEHAHVRPPLGLLQLFDRRRVDRRARGSTPLPPLLPHRSPRVAVRHCWWVWVSTDTSWLPMRRPSLVIQVAWRIWMKKSSHA